MAKINYQHIIFFFIFAQGDFFPLSNFARFAIGRSISHSLRNTQFSRICFLGDQRFHKSFVILCCSNNLPHLFFMRKLKYAAFSNSFLNSLNDIQIYCFKQRLTKYFYFETISLYFRIAKVQLRQMSRWCILSKPSSKKLFDFLLVANH